MNNNTPIKKCLLRSTLSALLLISSSAMAAPEGASYFNGGLSTGGIILLQDSESIPGYTVNVRSSGLARGEFGVSVHPFKYLHLNGGLSFNTYSQTYRYTDQDGNIVDNLYQSNAFGLHFFPSIDFTYVSVGYGLEAIVGNYGKPEDSRYFFGAPSGFIDAKVQFPGLLGNRSVVHIGYRRQTHRIQDFNEAAQAEYLYIGFQWLTQARQGSNSYGGGDWGDFNYDDYPDYPY